MNQDGKRVRHREGESRPADTRLFLLTAAVVLALMGTRLLLDTIWPMDRPEHLPPVVSEQTDSSSEEEQGLPPQKEHNDREKLEYIRTSGQYPRMLIRMAENYEETLDFVYNYPEHREQEQEPEIDLTEEAGAENVPLLMQWDERWGYRAYAGGLMGYTGCGPTCLSMAALYLTHDPKWTPPAIAKLAENWGYEVEDQGSSWTLFSEGSRLTGLRPEELPLSRKVMEQALDEGKLLILSVGKGDFTQSGHYLLITGYTEEGFTINDSNSRANSEKVWPYERLKGQIKNIWSLSV